MFFIGLFATYFRKISLQGTVYNTPKNIIWNLGTRYIPEYIVVELHTIFKDFCSVEFFEFIEWAILYIHELLVLTVYLYIIYMYLNENIVQVLIIFLNSLADMKLSLYFIIVFGILLMKRKKKNH